MSAMALAARPAADRRERALVRDAQRGSVRALEQLFRLHWSRAYRAAFLVVGDAAAAEDIAQESFLAAVRALDRRSAQSRARSVPRTHRWRRCLTGTVSQRGPLFLSLSAMSGRFSSS